MARCGMRKRILQTYGGETKYEEPNVIGVPMRTRPSDVLESKVHTRQKSNTRSFNGKKGDRVEFKS